MCLRRMAAKRLNRQELLQQGLLEKVFGTWTTGRLDVLVQDLALSYFSIPACTAKNGVVRCVLYTRM